MSMNDDLKKYPLYCISHSGELIPCEWIKTVDDYNHFVMNVHHFIPKGEYKRNKKWYDEHGIKQKLIYLPSWLHYIVHNEPSAEQVSDEEFLKRFKISRWELIFNRRYSEY